VYGQAISAWCTSNGAFGAPANATAAVTLGSDFYYHTVTVSITGLTPGMRYCVAIRANHSSATATGSPVGFTAGAPSAISHAVTTTGPTTASFYGAVNPAGQSTTYTVAYAPSKSPWCTYNGTQGTPSNSTTPQTLSLRNATLDDVWVSLTALSSGTAYCAAISASTTTTATAGMVGFTQNVPAVLNNSVSVVGATATIIGAVNPLGQTGTAYGVVRDRANSGWCASGGSIPDSTTTSSGASGSLASTDSSPFSLGFSVTPGVAYCVTISANNASGGTTQGPPIYFIAPSGTGSYTDMNTGPAPPGTGWGLPGPGPAPPPPVAGQPSDVYAESCATASSCMAVGFYDDSPGNEHNLAETWNGTTWTLQSSSNPAGAHDSFLNGVSCTSANFCVAVGYYHDSAGNEHGLAETWNGSTWTIQSSSNPAGAQDSFLNGVSCTSANFCVAVGYYYDSVGNEHNLAETSNGGAWTIQGSSNPAGARSSDLYDVSCSAANACMTVGYWYDSQGNEHNLAETWNGSAWTIQSSSNPAGSLSSRLNGVSCTTASFCMAVGYYYDSAGNYYTLAESWDASAWTLQSSANAPAGSPVITLDKVLCTAPTACTAVGYYGSGGASNYLTETWNGTTWTTT
jgi:hypothetical protein